MLELLSGRDETLGGVSQVGWLVITYITYMCGQGDSSSGGVGLDALYKQ